jgi:hypothetical protein
MWDPANEETEILQKIVFSCSKVVHNFELRIMELAYEPYTPKLHLAKLQYYRDIIIINRDRSHRAYNELISRMTKT